MGLLDGKTGLILNIANDRSIATHIATNCVKQGATCGFGFLPMDNAEKSKRRVSKAMAEGGFGDAWLSPCDVGSDESIAAFFDGAKQQFGKIDFLVHCLAFANRDYLKKDEGNFTSTPREVFRQAVDISAYSLIALSRAAEPLMADGGSHHRPDLPGRDPGHPRLQRHGRGQGRPGGVGPVPGVRPGGQEDPREHDQRRPPADPERHGRRRHRRDVRAHGPQGPAARGRSRATRSARRPSTCSATCPAA